MTVDVFGSTIADVLSQPMVRKVFSQNCTTVHSNPLWLWMSFGDDFGESGGEAIIVGRAMTPHGNTIISHHRKKLWALNILYRFKDVFLMNLT